MNLIASRLFSFALLMISVVGAASAADLPEIAKRGALRVLAVVIDAEPQFFSLKPDRAPGFDQEVLDGFTKLHRIKLEIVRISSYDALVPALHKGRGDLIAGGFTATDSRKKLIAFSEEVFPTRNVVYSRKPQPIINSVAELKSARIGTYKGTSMVEALLAAGIPASALDDTIELGGFPAALKAGKITAAVDGVEAALIARLADPELQIGMFLGVPESLAYGVRKQDTKLLEAINSYVGNVRKTQTWSRLVVKYFGASAPEILKRARGN
jgi:ABC-type amino acid transport substrate-binding protein